MITNIIEVMRALDYVLGSQTLSIEEKQAIAGELKASLPAKRLCSTAQRTHEIAEGLLERTLNGPIARVRTEDPRPSQEDTAEEQRLTGLGAGQDVIGRDDPKASGRSPKVDRGKRR